MKPILYVSLISAVLLAGLHTLAAQNNRDRAVQSGPKDMEKEVLKNAEREARKKDYDDLKESANKLAGLSKELSDDIGNGGEHVISAQIFSRLDKIDKLSRQIRAKAKGY